VSSGSTYPFRVRHATSLDNLNWVTEVQFVERRVATRDRRAAYKKSEVVDYSRNLTAIEGKDPRGAIDGRTGIIVIQRTI